MEVNNNVIKDIEKESGISLEYILNEILGNNIYYIQNNDVNWEQATALGRETFLYQSEKGDWEIKTNSCWTFKLSEYKKSWWLSEKTANKHLLMQKRKEQNALELLYRQEDVIHVDSNKCDLFSYSSEFGQLQETIYTAMDEISRLSSFGSNRDYEEFEFAHKVADLIDNLEAQVRIMNLVYENWYQIKEKKGELNE